MNINMEEAQKALEEFRKDTRWYRDHYEELRQQYPDHWIAVYREELAAASPDMDEIFDVLKKKGIPATEAYITYLSTEDVIWIFAAE